MSCIDGESASSASVKINNNHHDVHIAVSPKPQHGDIRIKKVQQTGDGTLITPADGDNYRVEVYNMDFVRVVGYK